MSVTKPIPVRLDHDLIKRLDEAAERLGNTRTGVIKLCLSAFLDHFEATGTASLPLNWREIVEYWDRRTRRSRGNEPRPSAFPDLQDGAHILKESASPAVPAEPSAPSSWNRTESRSESDRAAGPGASRR